MSKTDRTTHLCGPDCSHAVGDTNLEKLLQHTAVAAVFGGNWQRRAVLKGLGWSTALALIEQVLPIGSLAARAEDRLVPEKTELTVGFIPITCAAPLLYAAQQDLFRENGLDVELVKTPGWAVVRERLAKGHYDASHVLSPMPLAMTLGVDGPAFSSNLALIQNTNGQAITLANKHKDRRDPKTWKGFNFGVPYLYSMHNFLLRYYLAESGIDPDRDVKISAVPPPEMVAQLKAGAVDGYLSPEPFNQLAVHQNVGFIHLLTREIWDGHPCCGFAVGRDFAQGAPNTYLLLLKSIIKAATVVRQPSRRQEVANQLADVHVLNQPAAVLEAVLTGTFEDGLGNTRQEPHRIDFDLTPYPTLAMWMLTQMKRWGMVAGPVQYRDVAEQVFRLADATPLLRNAGIDVDPKGGIPTVLGRSFDSSNPDAYATSFAIKNIR